MLPGGRKRILTSVLVSCIVQQIYRLHRRKHVEGVGIEAHPDTAASLESRPGCRQWLPTERCALKAARQDETSKSQLLVLTADSRAGENVVLTTFSSYRVHIALTAHLNPSHPPPSPSSDQRCHFCAKIISCATPFHVHVLVTHPPQLKTEKYPRARSKPEPLPQHSDAPRHPPRPSPPPHSCRDHCRPAPVSSRHP